MEQIDDDPHVLKPMQGRPGLPFEYDGLLGRFGLKSMSGFSDSASLVEYLDGSPNSGFFTFDIVRSLRDQLDHADEMCYVSKGSTPLVTFMSDPLRIQDWAVDDDGTIDAKDIADWARRPSAPVDGEPVLTAFMTVAGAYGQLGELACMMLCHQGTVSDGDARALALWARQHVPNASSAFDEWLPVLLRSTRECSCDSKIRVEAGLPFRDVRLYRGVHDSANQSGLSWTTSFDIAEHYASGQSGHLLSVVAPADMVMAVYADDDVFNESEVLLDPAMWGLASIVDDSDGLH